MITVDIVGHIRTPYKSTLEEASQWSVIYIAMAIFFGGIIWAVWGGEYDQEHFAGYITEKTLSIDSLFVFVVMIAAFTVSKTLQQEVLLFGIAITLILRLVLILPGAALVENFFWVFYIFGAWLIWTALSQVREGTQGPSEHEAENYKPDLFVCTLAKMIPVSDGFYGAKLLYRHVGRTMVTPLLLAVIAIGATDVMFAVGSVPAVYSLAEEPYLVLVTSAFPLLGLRQLYFLIDGLLDRLIFLRYGLTTILGFIDFRLVSHALRMNEVAVINDGHPAELTPGPSTGIPFAFILTVLLITIVTSLTASARRNNTQSTPITRETSTRPTPIVEGDPVPTTSLDPLATEAHHRCPSAPSHGQSSCSSSSSSSD